MGRKSISVVLNVYKRSQNLHLQIAALERQTIRPLEILVWENGTDRVPDELRNNLQIARVNINLGVWSRFAYALNAKGEYICMLDDDTIPGEAWLENCLDTMKQTPGLLGTRGLIFENELTYALHRDVGVYAPNDETTQVDIVGHSWFFRREWLGVFWAEYPNQFPESLAGEDIHFSYVVQKFLGLPTLVPPHPKNNQTLWGSNPELAQKLGSGHESISRSSASLVRFEKALQHYRKIGFTTLRESGSTISRRGPLTYYIFQKFPNVAHKVVRNTRRFRGKS